ncbi:MAG: DEAD/DEAH box helicase [Proteobacteria bacterium]|nr:DEAD/DEAH box helicase [Pseudomonadota bacterium]
MRSAIWARKRTGAIPEAWLARHVLGLTPGADWPLQRAALEALLQRLQFARRDGLLVRRGPARRELFGEYKTRRAQGPARGYSTLLRALSPLRASCDCPDFVKSSLGLCKHLLTVVDTLAADAPRWQRALAGEPRATIDCGPWLSWNPVRPLCGAGDWLARVALQQPVPAPAGEPHGPRSRLHPAPARQRWFGRPVAGVAPLLEAFADDLPKRQRLVEALLKCAEAAPAGGAASVRVEPALRVQLATERDRLARSASCSLPAPELRRALRSLKVPLYPYQLEGVQRALRGGRLLLADDMGLGKTAQAIATAHVLWSTGRVARGLLVVPASLKPQWQREWQHFSDAPLQLVEGGPAERRRLYGATRRGFLLTNYEQVLRDLDELRRWGADLVVLDEAQRIKNWATKTAICVKQLEATYRVVLTGTPLENRLDELASILDWIDPLALAPKWRLGPWHSVVVDGTREVIGARNLDTLRERLAGCMLRRVRREVLTQLPPRTDTRLPVELTEPQRNEHDALNQPIAQLCQRARKRPLTQAEFLRLMQLLTMQRIYCNGLALANFATTWPNLAAQAEPTDEALQGLFSPKLRELREVVANLVVAQGRKVVVFSQWRRMLRLAEWALRGVLEGAGLRAVYFSGEEAQRRRTQNLVDFHDDPRTCVLLATDAGGVGLNLQRAASCVINLELPWNPAVLEQRIGRIYRLGQKLPIEVYHLVSEEGIESRIVDLVADKRALFTGLFDGTSDAVHFERSGSFLSQVERIVELPVVPLVDEGAETETETEAEAEAARLADVELATGAIHGGPGEAEDGAAGATDRGGVSGPSPRGGGAHGASPLGTPAEQLAALFSQLHLRPAPDGRVTIEAPAEAATALAAVFAGMARLLAGATPSAGPAAE